VRAKLTRETDSERTPTVAGNEPVTSPDQRKPVNPRKARIGAIVAVLLLAAMTVGNHKGNVENVWILATAGTIILMIVADWVLRRNGLRD
jgi:hypothetical protein